MSHIVGVFHSEADAEKALSAIYEMDIDSDDVTLLRGTGEPGDSATTTRDPNAVGIPIGAFTNPGHSSAANQTGTPALIATGLFSDLPLDSEKTTYFRRIADDGGIVIFVDTDDDDKRAASIEKSMRSANPSRVETF